MTFHPRHARRSLARAGAPDEWAKAATRRAAIGCCRPARKMCAGSNFLTLPAPALQARRVEGADRARNRAAPPRPPIPTARPRSRRPWARKAVRQSVWTDLQRARIARHCHERIRQHVQRQRRRL